MATVSTVGPNIDDQDSTGCRGPTDDGFGHRARLALVPERDLSECIRPQPSPSDVTAGPGAAPVEADKESVRLVQIHARVVCGGSNRGCLGHPRRAQRVGHDVGVLTAETIARWCESALGSAITERGDESGHLSRVAPVVLADGRRVVIKIRPWAERLRGCGVVQHHLATRGFPCPVPLAGPDAIDGFGISAETEMLGGTQRDPALGAAAYADLLHRLIAESPGLDSVPPLVPSPPWTGWEHPGRKLWPDRDDHGRALNDFEGPRWVDSTAAAVRRTLLLYRSPPCIGHGDWESQNLRWQGGQPLVVHDWDSVIAQPEAAIVGLAAAVWPAQGGPGEAATVEQTEAFLDAYERIRGGWSLEDRAAAWAAGLWVRLFNAKKDAIDGGGPQLDQLSNEVDERSARARLGG